MALQQPAMDGTSVDGPGVVETEFFFMFLRQELLGFAKPALQKISFACRPLRPKWSRRSQLVSVELRFKNKIKEKKQENGTKSKTTYFNLSNILTLDSLDF